MINQARRLFVRGHFPKLGDVPGRINGCGTNTAAFIRTIAKVHATFAFGPFEQDVSF